MIAVGDRENGLGSACLSNVANDIFRDIEIMRNGSERKLKGKMLKLISELIKNSRRSDREIAKAIGVSQPTVSRLIKKLEKERLLDYTSTPDLRKLGFEILAFTFGNWNRERFPDTRVDEMRNFISRHPNIIFVSTGTGLGWDRVGISVHKDYSDYEKLIQDFKSDWGEYFESLNTFIVSLKADNILRNLSFRSLVDTLKEE
jgi:DNA-binding Lrp family transcriptional regulator